MRTDYYRLYPVDVFFSADLGLSVWLGTLKTLEWKTRELNV